MSNFILSSSKISFNSPKNLTIFSAGVDIVDIVASLLNV